MKITREMIEKLRKKKREEFVAVDLKEKWEADGLEIKKKPLYDKKKLVFKKTSCMGQKRAQNPYRKSTHGISKSIELNKPDSTESLIQYKQDIFADVMFKKKLREEI